MSLPNNPKQLQAITLQEFEDALTLSGNLYQTNQNSQQRTNKIKLSLITTWLLTISIDTAALISPFTNSPIEKAITITAIILTITILIMSVYMLNSITEINKELLTTQKSANKIFPLLHESKDFVYLTQTVGLLKRTELEIRLARLESYALQADAAPVAFQPSSSPITNPTHAR